MEIDSERLENAALFRFSVVSKVRALALTGVPLATAVREISSIGHENLDDIVVSVSQRSLYRWYAEFQSSGFPALIGKSKRGKLPSRVLSEGFLNFLRVEKTKDPKISIPSIIKKARASNIVGHHLRIDRVTVLRTAKRMKLPCLRETKYDKMRKFEISHRMQCCSVMASMSGLAPIGSNG